MPDQTILCPQCKTPIPLSDALLAHTHDIEAEVAAKLEAQHAAKLKELAQKEQDLATQLEKKVAAEKKKIWAVALQKAAEHQKQQLADLENQVKESTSKLVAAEQQELQLRKKARELEEQQRRAELELTRKLDAERRQIEDAARKVEAESSRLKIQEKDKQMEILKKTIEDLKRQSEQGSMQIQGEVQEDSLKQLLTEAFPSDSISDIATGARGADLLQVINGKVGAPAGKIIWESKNTKTFSDGWLSKLKADQGRVQANVAVLVTKALPDGVTAFTQRNGIWIVRYDLAGSLAMTLRFHLAEVAKAQIALEGREEKAELLYGYLASAQFKNRVENLVMAFIEMKQDLETEKRSFQRLWSKREKEIEKMFGSTASLYGDLQGIIGGALPSIPQLELPGSGDTGSTGLFEEKA